MHGATAEDELLQWKSRPDLLHTYRYGDTKKRMSGKASGTKKYTLDWQVQPFSPFLTEKVHVMGLKESNTA